METLPLVFSSGWASGVNAYLVILVLGIADRVGNVAEVPDVLSRWEVLAAAAFMYAMEFVADKIPYVDSTWDVISTAIRPTAGAVIGVLLAGEAGSLNEAVAGVVGGTSALASHLVKAGGRLAINSSPEPVTNIAATIAGVLLVAGLLMLYLIAKLVRRGWRRWKGQDRGRRPPISPQPGQ